MGGDDHERDKMGDKAAIRDPCPPTPPPSPGQGRLHRPVRRRIKFPIRFKGTSYPNPPLV